MEAPVMLRKIRNLTSKQWTIIGLVIFVIILILLLPLSVPLIAALFTAILLNPIVRLLQYKGKFGRTLSVVIVFLILLFLIGFVSTFIVLKLLLHLLTLSN